MFLIVDKKSALFSVIFMNPGPADSTFSKILRLFNFSTSVVESSFGFNFKLLAKTIHILEV